MLCNGHLGLRKLYNDSEQDSETIYAGIPRSQDICRIFFHVIFLSSPCISNLSIKFAIFPSSILSETKKYIILYVAKSIQGQ